MGRWPGAGPGRAQRFVGQGSSKAYPPVSGIAFNPSAAVAQALGGYSNIASIYVLPIPITDPSIVNFSFPTSTADGSWSFLFKWYDAMAQWNCWVTMPDGTVRPAGCIPLVLNWTAYHDYSIVFISDLVTLGKGDLVGSNLLIVKWQT